MHVGKVYASNLNYRGSGFRANKESMKKIIIVGASDAFESAQAACGEDGGVVIGYCSAKPIDRSPYCDFPWLGADLPAAVRAHAQCAVILAVFDNVRRRAMTEEVLAAGGEIFSVVDPNTVVFPTAKLGRGVLVQAFVTVSTEARVDDGVCLGYGCLVGHDVRVGAFSFIAPGVRLLNGVDVGEGALIGANAVLFPHVKVGDGARITAGAVVHRNVPARATLLTAQRIRLLGGRP